MRNPANLSRKSRLTLYASGLVVAASAMTLAHWARGQSTTLNLAPADGGQPSSSAGGASATRPSPAATGAMVTSQSANQGDGRVAASSGSAGASTAYYPFNASTENILTAWQQLAKDRSDLRVVIDEEKSQAMVFATAAVQAQIREQLGNGAASPIARAFASVEQPGSSAAAPVEGTPTPALAAAPAAVPAADPASVGAAAPAVGGQIDQTPSTATLTLRNLPGAELHPRLEKIYSRSLNTGNDASGVWQTITIDPKDGNRVTLAVNHQTSEVRIAGGDVDVVNWQQIIEAIDAPRTSEGGVTEVVAAKPSFEPFVRRAIGALQMGGVAARGTAAVASMLYQPAGQAGGALPPPAGAAAQPGAQSQALPAPQGTGAQSTLAQLSSEGLLGPVDIRFIEGSNIVIIRGREQDVQQVREIIRQIEEITRTSAPDVRVHNLTNVDSASMGALVTRVYTEIFQPRLGAIHITALSKPNALLLIGPATTLDMVINTLVTPLDTPQTPQMRFEVFPLKNIPAQNAKATVDAYLGGALDPTQVIDLTDPNAIALRPRAVTIAVSMTNSLIVAAGPRDIAEVSELIRRIDQPPEIAAQVKVFEIQNGDAVSLVQSLQQLFSIGQTADTPPAPAGYGQAGLVPLTFSVDARTNSIIAVGTAEQLEVVNNILTVLDTAEIRQRETRVIRMFNASAGAIATAAQNWILQQREIEVASGIITPFSLYQREVIIVAEPATNNLIISAAPAVIDQIVQNVITPLDKRPPMVVIQVLIAELRLTDTDEFGVELGVQDALLFNRSIPNGIPGFNFLGQPLANNVTPETLVSSSNVGTQGVSNFGVGRVNSELGFGGFVFSAQSESVNVLLRALQEKRRLEILSRPQITALDAQRAQILVGQNVPIITSTINNAGLGGGQQNSYQYVNVGLQLDVIPLISPDNRVVMQITAIKSEVGPEAEGIPIQITETGDVLRVPRIDNITATTAVSAQSGQTVVLGGLITTRKEDIHRRVPLIGDIPLIGDLFRFDAVGEARSELLIILTPRVINSTEDAEHVKHIESSRMSWILRDVISLNGPSGLRDRCSDWFPTEVDEIYPSVVPGAQVCPTGEPMMSPAYGPGAGPTMIVPIPAAAPSNAPAAPQQPGQGDFTQNRYGTQTGAVQPARYETSAVPTQATNTPTAARLPQVK